MWRTPPVDSSQAIESLILPRTANFSAPGGILTEKLIVVAVLQAKDAPKSETKIIRTFDADDGAVLWNLPGCGIGVITIDEVTVPKNVIPIFSCSSGETSFHDAFTGRDITEQMMPGGEMMEQLTSGGKTFAPRLFAEQEGRGEISRASVITWKNVGVGGLRQVQSRANGAIAVRAMYEDLHIASRHEGMAHAIAGMFLSSTRKSDKAPDTLILLSEFGTLFALDLTDGALRWTHIVEPYSKTPQESDCNLVKGHAHHAVVVCAYGGVKAKSGQTTVSIVDGTSGKALVSKRIDDFRAAHAFAQDCFSDRDVCIHIVDAGGSDRMVTTLGDGFGHLEESPTYFSISEDKASVEGHRFKQMQWRFALPAGRRLAAFSFAGQPHPSSRSFRKAAVRVTGDRRILYKYSQAGTLLLLAASEAESDGGLTAILVNGTNGGVLKAMEHVNASKPFAAVSADNWMAYSFWNTYLLQQELHVVDMYEQRPEPNLLQAKAKQWAREVVSPVARALGVPYEVMERLGVRDEVRAGEDGGQSICSEADGLERSQCAAAAADVRERSAMQIEPKLVHTAFLLSHQIHRIDVSETEGGLTERSVLFTLASGEVVSLSRLAIDARRPMKAGVESEEGLSVYYPYISFFPPQRAGLYLTAGKAVQGIAGVEVAPVPKQESSCHIVAFGTDIFYRKYAPAGKFDMLPDDFRYAAVVMSVVFLGAAAYYFEYALENKQLMAAWG